MDNVQIFSYVKAGDRYNYHCDLKGWNHSSRIFNKVSNYITN
jgi:hypothetical protein